MRIDIHCHTFNASDIPLVVFLGDVRFATGWVAEIWYDMPRPVKKLTVELIRDLLGQGPTAAQELADLTAPKDAPLVAKSAAKSATTSAEPPARDLATAARDFLLDAFDDPADPVLYHSRKSLFGRNAAEASADAAAAKIDDEAVFDRIVEYVLPPEEDDDSPPDKQIEPGVLAGSVPLSIKQYELWQWIPEPESPSPEDVLLDQQVDAALDAAVEEREQRRSNLPGPKALPRSWRGASWIRKLARRAVRWAEKTGRTAREARELVRGLARRIRRAMEPIERLLAFVELVPSPRQRIVQSLCDTYPGIQLFTPALVDYTGVSREKPGSGLVDQVRFWQEFAALRARAGAKPLIHQFFPFDPYWLVPDDTGDEDALRRELEKLTQPIPEPWPSPSKLVRDPCRVYEGEPDILLLMRYALEKGGCIGIKLYPPALFAPYGNKDAQKHFDRIRGGHLLDIVLARLYEFCADHDVPILAHTSDGNAFAKGHGKLAGPRYWKLALEQLSEERRRRLRVCFGHFGHFHTPDGDEEDWAEALSSLIQDSEFLYGDVGNSEVPGRREVKERFVERLQMLVGKYPRLSSRLLYGSDWMLNNLQAAHDKYFDSFVELFENHPALKAHADAFLGGNAIRFLFLNADGTPSKNYQRLQRFYEAAGAPFPEILHQSVQAHGQAGR